MFVVSRKVLLKMRVRGLPREVQAVASGAGKRNSPHELTSEKDDNKQTLIMGYGIWDNQCD